jgi:predicted O-methyltransferase YrrM
MNKLFKILKAFRLLAAQPSLINHILESDDVYKKQILKKYPQYLSLPVISIGNFFMRQTVYPYAFLEGGSLPTDLALLRSLAAGIKDCNYLEIGSWRGESLANVAPFAKKCTSLNLSDEEMKSMGLPDHYINQHYFFSKKFSNIETIRGNSLTYDFSRLEKSFDLVFVDGDHHYSSVKKDTESVFSVLKNENSIIVWHDYAKNPLTPRHEVLAGILEGTPAHLRKHLYHVSNTLCAIYIRKDLQAQDLKDKTQPELVFKAELNAEKL